MPSTFGLPTLKIAASASKHSVCRCFPQELSQEEVFEDSGVKELLELYRPATLPHFASPRSLEVVQGSVVYRGATEVFSAGLWRDFRPRCSHTAKYVCFTSDGRSKRSVDHTSLSVPRLTASRPSASDSSI